MRQATWPRVQFVHGISVRVAEEAIIHAILDSPWILGRRVSFVYTFQTIRRCVHSVLHAVIDDCIFGPIRRYLGTSQRHFPQDVIDTSDTMLWATLSIVPVTVGDTSETVTQSWRPLGKHRKLR